MGIREESEIILHETKLGWYYIEYQNNTLCAFRACEQPLPENKGNKSDFAKLVCAEVDEYIKGERFSFSFKVTTSHLTDFQQLVLCELQRIPYGEHRTYKQIAECIGRPNAARAVGGACNKNPIHIIIPCHRVVGSSGALTGYAGGLERKSKLLEIESISKKKSQNLKYRFDLFVLGCEGGKELFCK